jgi:nucleoside-diphosphate-sugar epimerase
MKTAWLTGATGYLGSHFVSRLKARHPEMKAVALTRKDPGLSKVFTVATPKAQDFSLEELQKLARTHPPDLIVHFATHFLNAYTAEESEVMIDANIRFPVRMLEACRDCKGLSFLNFGSFYSHADLSLDEPLSFYAASKRAFESFLQYYVQALSGNAITLKLYDVYGPKDPRKKLIPKFVEILKSGASMDLSPGDQKLSLVHVDDVMAATDIAISRLAQNLASRKSSHEIFQLPAASDPNALPSLKEIVNEFERAAGKKIGVRFGALPYREREIMRPTLPFESLPDWKPKVSLSEGFRLLIQSEH